MPQRWGRGGGYERTLFSFGVHAHTPIVRVRNVNSGLLSRQREALGEGISQSNRQGDH